MKMPQAAAAQPTKALQVPYNKPLVIPTPAVTSKLAAAVKPKHEDIAKLAYQIYTEKGCPQDQSVQIWRQAEMEQMNRISIASRPK